jgi:hypothetical protein
MKLNEPIYAVINPATLEVLGDGDCPALHSTEIDAQTLDWVRTICDCPQAIAVRCMLTHLPDAHLTTVCQLIAEVIEDGQSIDQVANDYDIDVEMLRKLFRELASMFPDHR